MRVNLPTPQRRTGAGILTRLLILLGSILFVFVLLLDPSAFHILLSLVFGWFLFLTRTIPQMEWNGSLIGMGLLSLGALILGVQALFRWVIQARSSGDPETATRQQAWRISICGVAGFLLLTVSAVVVAGIGHHVTWMKSSPEPVRKQRNQFVRYYSDMKQLGIACEMAALDVGANVEKMRELVWNKGGVLVGNLGQQFREEYQVFLIVDSNSVLGGFIYPRQPEIRQQVKALYWLEDADRQVDQVELRELMRQHAPQLVAF